jgi:hypothetical protein
MTFQRAEAPPLADAGRPARRGVGIFRISRRGIDVFGKVAGDAETDGAGVSDAAEKLSAAEEGAVQSIGRPPRPVSARIREIPRGIGRQQRGAESASLDRDRAPANITNGTDDSVPKSVELGVDPTAELACCLLRLANLPNYALERLGRYEATLGRQVRQILFGLDALDRRKPQDRSGRFRLGSRQGLPAYEPEEW